MMDVNLFNHKGYKVYKEEKGDDIKRFSLVIFVSFVVKDLQGLNP
jgi:hypothetical protein